MLLNALSELVRASQELANSLGKGGLSRPSRRIQKIVDMLSMVSSGSEEEAKKKLVSKAYKDELDFLFSAVTDIKGLKDMCPQQLGYDDWRRELLAVSEALSKVRSY